MQETRMHITRKVEEGEQHIIVCSFPKWLGWLLVVIFAMQINLVYFGGNIVKTAAENYYKIKEKAIATRDDYYQEYINAIMKHYRLKNGRLMTYWSNF